MTGEPSGVLMAAHPKGSSGSDPAEHHLVDIALVEQPPRRATIGSGKASAITPGRRAGDIACLSSVQLDVLVVGGGVVGAGSALDAVTRGLSTGLVEAQDWASGTSSRSTKLVHGGLRYLQMLDFKLVHQALKERDLLLRRLAPHLVQPVPVLYPLRGKLFERVYVGAGIGLYDLLGWSSGRSSSLPWHKHFSKRQALNLAPGLKRDVLAGAIRYYDAQVDDARYVLELVRTAASYGAVPVSRLRVAGLLREGDRVVGAQAVDAETGQKHEIRARSTILATGAWTEETEAFADEGQGALVRPSKGVHLVLPKNAVDSSVGLILRTEKSVLFLLPWLGHWLVGTTDTDWPYEKARPVATASDIDYLLKELSSVLEKPLSRDDVEAVFAGLRPLIAGVGVVRGPGEMGRFDGSAANAATTATGAGTAKLSREHAVSQPAPGLVVISGGKYTTYRVMAADAVDAAIAAAPDGSLAGAEKSGTQDVPLIGARGFSSRWQQRDKLAERYGLEAATMEHLLRRYGGLVDEVLALIEAQPDLAGPLEGAEGYLRAEAVYGVTHEGARHLDDLLARRTRVAIETRNLGIASAPSVCELVAPLLGWDDAACAAEIDDYRRLAELEREASLVAGDEEAAAIVSSSPTLMPLP